MHFFYITKTLFSQQKSLCNYIQQNTFNVVKLYIIHRQFIKQSGTFSTKKVCNLQVGFLNKAQHVPPTITLSIHKVTKVITKVITWLFSSFFMIFLNICLLDFNELNRLEKESVVSMSSSASTSSLRLVAAYF